MNFDIPRKARFLFTSDDERAKYATAARNSKTDIRVLIAEKLKLPIPRHVAVSLSEEELAFLLNAALRAADQGFDPVKLEAKIIRTLAEQHPCRSDVVGRFLMMKLAANLPMESDAISRKDFFAKERRLPGHFEANS